MVISSGMQSMETMHCVYQTVKKHNPNFTFLQCTSAYPLPLEHANLSLIPVRQATLILSTTKLLMKMLHNQDFFFFDDEKNVQEDY